MNSLKSSIGKWIAVYALIFFASSCKKLEFDKIAQTAWNPNLAIPLAYADFGVYDILARQDSTDLVVIDPSTGAIALVYKGEIASYDAQTIIQLDDQTQQSALSLAELSLTAAPAFSGTVSVNETENVVFAANAGVELHQVNFKDGMLNLNVSTELKHDISVVVTFPEFTLNNTPVSRILNLTYTGSTPQTATASIDLTDVLADFTLGSTTVNSFPVTFQTTITGTGENVVGTENINFAYNFSAMEFENAIGYFGQQNLGISNDTILLRLFESTTDGYFELTNPTVRFIVENSFGFPVRINFAEMKTINTITGQEFPLTGFPSTFNINSPAAMGTSTTSTLELNTSNTANLTTIISSVPKFFYFEANALSNPSGAVPPLNFVEDDSRFTVRTEVELPLEGLAYGFELRDTVDFNFNESVDEIESVMFRVISDNGFPVAFKAQMTFMDQNYTPLFTIYGTPQDVLQAALVDNEGKVNQRTKAVTDATLTEGQIALLPNAKYILINGVAQTLEATNGEIVKLYDTYKLNLKLAMQVQGSLGF